MTDLEIPDTGAVFTFGKSRFAENKPSHFFIKNDPVIHVACGDEHTAVICKNGRIFAFGSNEWGQLGLGHNNMVHKPSCIKVLKPEKAKYIACGRAHTIILTESNNIYACGSNTDGQLGLDNIDMVNTPTKLQHYQFKENGVIKKLAAGSQHSAALTESGIVFVWGSNSEGQLGLESNRTNTKLPTILEFKEKIQDISCGYYHTAVITETGQLYTFGESEHGKLGLPQTEGQLYKPTLVAHVPASALASISCGGHHNIALTPDGTAIAFGSNANGELGLGRDIVFLPEPKIIPAELFEGEKIVAVSCGDNHTAFITETFKIFTCGDPRHGKLCQDEHNINANTDNSHFLPEQISRFANYKIMHISCGGCHTIICAQKLPEDASLPPLQRIPNSLTLDPRTDVTLETIPTVPHVNKDCEVGNETENNIVNNQLNGVKMSDEETPEKIASLSDEIDKLPDNISDIIKSQKERLDIEYEKTITTIKNESQMCHEEINDKIDDFISADKDVLKPLQDNNLPADSVDNLLQEIEDDLSSKSGKTATSDTISVKSHEKQVTSASDEIEEVNDEQKSSNTENDDSDLKTEQVIVPQSEKKLSRLFGTFKRKKISSSSNFDSKIVEMENVERKASVDSKKDEITVIKTDKTKTCTIL